MNNINLVLFKLFETFSNLILSKVIITLFFLETDLKKITKSLELIVIIDFYIYIFFQKEVLKQYIYIYRHRYVSNHIHYFISQNS